MEPEAEPAAMNNCGIVRGLSELDRAKIPGYCGMLLFIFHEAVDCHDGAGIRTCDSSMCQGRILH